ncbi:unnamed protein product [Musa acuminata subsp. burmannicoides]
MANGIHIEKALSSCLGCGGAAGGWSKLLLLVALVTSAAALFASFSSNFGVSFWFSAPSSLLASYRDVVANSSTEELVLPSLPPPRASSPSLAPLLPPASLSQDVDTLIGSPVPTATPAFFAPPPSPAKDADDLEVYAGEYDPKMPPLEPEPALTPSPGFAPVTTSLSPPLAHPPSPVVNFADTKRPPPTTSVPFPSPIETSNAAEVKASSVFWRETDRQLMYAKREIASAPAGLNDPDLHAPLFLNVSIFKRSYEMMERILKVYIYKDGPKPLFHTPELGGIYASEGWFMRLMEQNKQFVVKDPEKAHLFYMAYSSRQLRAHLYVPDSHTSRPLSIFLRDYVNMISAKYPFWNRTRGADHFLVGCHDWATYTTRMHDELRKNAIKAVCNADVSEGIFIRGKDVSLPETYIRAPKRPQRGIGGKPASKRSILAFFAGHMHGRVRPILLRHWRGRDRDMRIYEALPQEIASKMSYVEHMKSSKFCICPMGYEVNSPRIVEAIYYECVPVVIADNFVLPFEQVLDWSAFSVVVAEKEIPKLKDILLGISLGKYTTMQMNVKKLQKHFLWNVKPRKYDLFHMILHSIWFNRLNQIHVR